MQLIELHLKRGVVAINSRLINGVRGNLMLTTLLIDACVRRNYPLIVCLAALIGRPVYAYIIAYTANRRLFLDKFGASRWVETRCAACISIII